MSRFGQIALWHLALYAQNNSLSQARSLAEPEYRFVRATRRLGEHSVGWEVGERWRRTLRVTDYRPITQIGAFTQIGAAQSVPCDPSPQALHTLSNDKCMPAELALHGLYS